MESRAMFLLLLNSVGHLLNIRSASGQNPPDVYPISNVTVAQMSQLTAALTADKALKPQDDNRPRDCAEIMTVNANARSGVYTIYPTNCPGPTQNSICSFNVWCDMDHEGGGWTVIMRRRDGSTDFYRGWDYYECGFGSIFAEFYLGNNRIHMLSTQKPSEMRIFFKDVGDQDAIAGYSRFTMDDAATNYAIHTSSYYGDAGDYLYKSNGRPFSTFDRDNDGTLKNCAEYFHSAWWYNSFGECHSASNLFGYYFLGKQELPHFAGPGMSWKPVPGPGGPALRTVVMMIRPMGFLGGPRIAPGVSGPIRPLQAAAAPPPLPA